jgi:hypothetical protein
MIDIAAPSFENLLKALDASLELNKGDDSGKAISLLCHRLVEEVASLHSTVIPEQTALWSVAERVKEDLWEMKRTIYFGAESFSKTGLNGQFSKQLIWKDILADKAPDVAVETGTYLGHTTAFLAQFVPSVMTIEVHPPHFKAAADYFSTFRNIKQFEGASQYVLPDVLKEVDPARHLFVYLDAHWDDNLPLREEIVAIFDGPFDPIVMIDDFMVEGDAGYGYDKYNVGEISFDHLADLCEKYDLLVFYPTVPSNQDHCLTDYVPVRGTAVIARKGPQAERLSTYPSLRRFDPQA